MHPTKVSGSFSKQSENVNGALLTLSVHKSSGPSARQQRRFTVRFGPIQALSDSGAKTWPRLALATAILFNILAMLYTQVSLPTLLVTVSVFGVLALMWVTHSVQYESVLVVPTVGIQSSVKYVQGRQEEFIPWNSIDDVVINEVIHLNRVLYYLTVLVDDSGQTKLIPLFKFTKPRLAMLECIYSEIQGLLQMTTQGHYSGSGDNSMN